MKCPACKRDHVQTTYADDMPSCGCGYVFSGAQRDSLAALSAALGYLRTIKNIMVVWTVLAAIGWVITLIVFAVNAH